eukprot:TRINITY_DN55003_c0_g1_i3.p1 TRINITY_DN55003_c0_g1~~TRINITY_DN55003_c0_g1_i3.p1  ORF type:complete len:139 (+),score=17.08 TRINITY_DN55003_c0_g1_i3:16-432(+)
MSPFSPLHLRRFSAYLDLFSFSRSFIYHCFSTNFLFFFFLMIRRPPRSTLSSSSAASDVYKRQVSTQSTGEKRRIHTRTTFTTAHPLERRSAKHQPPTIINLLHSHQPHHIFIITTSASLFKILKRCLLYTSPSPRDS